MSSAVPALRVLLVTPRYYPESGGVETHVHEVSRRLAQRGVEVTVLATDRTGSLPVVEESDGVTVRRTRAWPAKRDYYFAPFVYRCIGQERWDIVHCQGVHTLVPPLAMAAARRFGVPYVVTFHTGGHSSGLRNAARGLQWTALRPLLAGARRLIGVSQFEVDLFRSRLRLPSERFAVIPNGASLPAVEPSGEGTTPGTQIVSVGRLERYKGHHRVLAALPLVRQRCPDARLLILGSGPYEPALRQMARDLGVAEQVEIRAIPPGDRQGMAAALAGAAVVALLSDYEAHPLAVMEALALGRPVLVADTSGLSELARMGQARAVPLQSTPQQVAAALLEQMRTPLLPRPVDLPTWERCTDELLSVYRSGTRRVTAECAS